MPVSIATTHMQSSSHKPSALRTGSSTQDLAGSNRDIFSTPPSSPTLPDPIVHYEPDGPTQCDPSTNGATDHSVTEDRAAGANAHTETKSPPPADTHANKPADKSADRPVETPVDKPAERGPTGFLA